MLYLLQLVSTHQVSFSSRASSSTKSLEFKGKKSKNPAPISFTDWPGKSRDSCHINLSLPWLIFVQNMISNIPYLFLLDDDGLRNVIEGQTLYILPLWKQSESPKGGSFLRLSICQLGITHGFVKGEVFCFRYFDFHFS